MNYRSRILSFGEWSWLRLMIGRTAECAVLRGQKEQSKVNNLGILFLYWYTLCHIHKFIKKWFLPIAHKLSFPLLFALHSAVLAPFRRLLRHFRWRKVHILAKSNHLTLFWFTEYLLEILHMIYWLILRVIPLILLAKPRKMPRTTVKSEILTHVAFDAPGQSQIFWKSYLWIHLWKENWITNRMVGAWEVQLQNFRKKTCLVQRDFFWTRRLNESSNS